MQEVEYKLKKGELLQVKSDIVFHYLINEENMSAIEWLVMRILKCNYEDIHNKVMVKNVRESSLAYDNTTKYVDLIVNYKDDIILIELNNNFDGNYTRNVIYTMNAIVNGYRRELEKAISKIREKRSDLYKEKRVRGILVNLNWLNAKYKVEEAERIEEHTLGYPIMGEEDSDFMLKIVNVNLLRFFRNVTFSL